MGGCIRERERLKALWENDERDLEYPQSPLVEKSCKMSDPDDGVRHTPATAKSGGFPSVGTTFTLFLSRTTNRAFPSFS
jgi:hypothetical protein